MDVVLVIAANPSTRTGWCQAVRARGLGCRCASSIVAARSELTAPSLAGIVFGSETDDDLAELMALAEVQLLPPVVLVTASPRSARSTRWSAATIVDPATASGEVIARLARLVGSRPPSSPTWLPVRLSAATDAQWTVRLSATRAAAVDDDGFDGGTHPMAFELARA